MPRITRIGLPMDPRRRALPGADGEIERHDQESLIETASALLVVPLGLAAGPKGRRGSRLSVKSVKSVDCYFSERSTARTGEAHAWVNFSGSAINS